MSTDYSKAREEISDNHAIMGNNSREYAECLVNLAEKTALVNRLPFLQGLAVPHIPLRERICQILSKERIMATETKKTTTFIILIGFVLSLGLVAGYKWTFASEKIEMATEIAQDTSTQNQEKKEQEKEKQKEKKKKEEEQAKKEELAEAEELSVVIELKLAEELASVMELSLGTELMVMNEMEQTKKEAQEKEEELEMKIKEIMKILGKELSKIKKMNIETIEQQETSLSEEQKEEIRKLVKELVSNLKYDKAKAIPAVMIHADTLSDQEKEELKKNLKVGVKISEMNKDLKYGIKVDLKRANELDFKPNIRVDLKPAIEVDDEGKVVVKVKPVLVVKVQPEFPEEAKEKGIYGEIVVEGTTNKKGEVVKVKVLKGAHELLNEAVIAAVKQWKYELPEYKGKTYAITFVVTVRFDPKDKDGNPWTVSIDS